MKKLMVVAMLAIPALAAGDKREVPDYDGRGDEPTTAGDVALWVPRVVLSPLYLTSEYAIRRPMGWLVVNGERGKWLDKIIDVFTTDDRKLGVVPSFFFERGFHPVAGVYAFVDDLGAPGNDLRLSGSLGFGHRALTVTDRFRRAPLRLTLRAHASDRDDYLAQGVGPDVPDAERARYGARRLAASAAMDGKAGPLRARVELGWRDVDFRGSTFGGDPSIDEASPRFADYGSGYGRLELVLDTRVESGSGVRLAADVEHGSRWTRTSASAAGSVGLGRGRVASLGASAAMVEEHGDDVPYTELVSIGGSGPLPGFADGRLVGRSSVAAIAQYEWPVAPWLNGALHASAGNVYGDHFEGFDVGLARFSGGLGLRTAGSADHRLEVLIALGTRPVQDGAGIDSVRLVIGGTHAF